ncbi:hypothetical protein AB0C08_22015 [Microbispora bryophytorum]|uniref:hypothetical protein n=1 Tax=Microbispora bryophytorum TaxID=1460882 RepID=UPI00340EFC88
MTMTASGPPDGNGPGRPVPPGVPGLPEGRRGQPTPPSRPAPRTPDAARRRRWRRPGPGGYTFDPASGDTVTINPSLVSARYVRITATGNTGWPAARIGELEVYAG